MKITQDPASKRYRARVRAANGKHVRIPLKTKSGTEAHRLARAAKIHDIETAARVNALTRETVSRITAGKKITMQQAIETWAAWLPAIGRAPRSIDNYVQGVRAFCRACDLFNKPPSSVDEKMVSSWINNPHMNAKLNYRRILLSQVSSFFQFTAQKGWSLGDPCMLVKINMNVLTFQQKETKEVETFEDEEIKTIVRDKDTPEFWRVATELSYETAIRLTDICQLEWASFEKPGKVVVWTDKRDKRIAVSISKRLQDLISDLPVMSGRFLFPEQRAMALDIRRRAILSTQFKRICARHDIEGKSFHGIRHTTITRWDEEGKSLEQIGELVGHSDTKTTKGYIHKKKPVSA